MTKNPMVCGCCGKPLEGLPQDMAFRLPDAVVALPPAQRDARVRANSDLCQMDDRFFLRAVLTLPFAGREGAFRWGVWLEVEAPVFKRYVDLYNEDASGEPAHPATLANQPPGYERAVGVPVLVEFGDGKQRPLVAFPQGATHTLARQQAFGLSPEDYHALLRNIGVKLH